MTTPMISVHTRNRRTKAHDFVDRPLFTSAAWSTHTPDADDST